MKRLLSASLMGVALLAIAVPGHGAEITLQNTQGLSFGSFVAGSGGSVTVGTDNSRIASGAVQLIPSSRGTAALFTVSGDASATYAIQLPADDFVKLVGPGGEMLISRFTSTPNGVGGQLGMDGLETLRVGATLDVGAAQAPGDYAGNFTVTVQYN